MNETKKNVFDIVNERIIAELEKGVVPWHQPWTNAGRPANLISGRHYRNINHLLLAMHGYERNLFLTFNQANEIGAKIKKGEHAHIVVFSKREDTKIDEHGKEETTKRVLRYYMVFNIAQCENIPEKYVTPLKDKEMEPLHRCAEIVEWMPNRPEILHEQDEAFYRISEDKINMPPFSTFESSKAYYNILFHELVHSTGHTDRLNRPSLVNRDKENYSIDELVAEIGACYLLFESGVSEGAVQTSAAYIDLWLKMLKNDRRYIFIASSQAQKAVDYILGHIEPKQTSEANTEAQEMILSDSELDDLPF